MRSVDEVMQVELDRRIAEKSGMAEGYARPYIAEFCRDLQDALHAEGYRIVPADRVIPPQPKVLKPAARSAAKTGG